MKKRAEGIEKRMKIRQGKIEHFRTDIRTDICSSVMRPAPGTENNLFNAITQLSGLHSHFKHNVIVPQTITAPTDRNLFAEVR